MTLSETSVGSLVSFWTCRTGVCGNGAPMIPYAEITETADRRWTFRLLERLGTADLSVAERDDLVAALQAVSDPRALGPLEAALCDAARPAGVRRAASAALRGMHYLVRDVSADTLRRWWREGDAALRRHALLSIDGTNCPDIVLAVAKNPVHELHGEALGRMNFLFDLPEHEEVKIAALGHPDPQVRETAATVLLWDEPVRAEGPLIAATLDPVPAVAAEACHTLQYYPSLRTASCLYRLRDHPAEKVRQEAAASFESVRGEFLLGLRLPGRQVTDHVRRWLEPVWDVLAFTADELRPVEGDTWPAQPPAPKQALPLSTVLEMLAHPDASPKTIQESLWSNDWRLYTETEWRRLRRALLDHSDPLVRQEAASAFESWHDADGLLALVEDDDFSVRKAAVYQLGRLPPRLRIADLAWEHLQRPDVLGVHAIETLDTFVRHADPEVAVRRLSWIAGDHGRREELRTAALYHLTQLPAVEQLAQLAGLLLELPVVTWSLHIAWLDAKARLGLPSPDIGHLLEVDNLHVQEAVSRCHAFEF